MKYNDFVGNKTILPTTSICTTRLIYLIGLWGGGWEVGSIQNLIKKCLRIKMFQDKKNMIEIETGWMDRCRK